MHIKIFHKTHYRYLQPARGVIQVLRLTPRNHEGLHIFEWRVEVDVNARLRESEDSLGNIVHTLDASGPIEELTVTAEGEVETLDTAGIVRGVRERFPEFFYLRNTPMTVLNGAMIAYVRDLQARHHVESDRLAFLHALMQALHRDMVFDTNPTHVATTAQEAFAMRKGVCQDLTQVFCGMARHCGIPARYVSGYFRRGDDVVDQDAGHAWAEAFIEGLGWVSFDPANGICATDQHVRVAIGLDYLGASPVRGSHTGGSDEQMHVSLRVSEWQAQVHARMQGQWQSQS
ncbi:MAG: transglutaminase family protein [Beijerinckiaceae bacterium]